MRFNTLITRLSLILTGIFLSSAAFSLESVTLQLKWMHAFQFAGYYAAKEQGYYRDAGLDVNIVEAGPNTDPVRDVLNSTSQYGVGTSSLLLERAAGKPVVVLAVVFQQSPYEIYAAPHIRELKDLVGKRIMLEPQSEELLAFLQKRGVPINSIKQTPHDFDVTSLKNGQVDAISGYVSNEPFYFRQASYPYQTFSPRSAGIDFYGDNLFTSEQELQAHPQRVKAFRAASLRGWQYAKEHRDEVIDLILAKYSSKHTREYLNFESDQMIPLLQPNLIEIGYMNPSRWRDIANTYADIGLLPRNFELKNFLYDATEPDLTWIYRLLAGGLILVAVTTFIAFYINRINRKLLASGQQNLIIQEDLRRSNATIQRSLAEKSRFMDMLTHELKTPISVLRIALENLKAEGPSRRHADQALEDMSGIVDRCRQLDQLEQHKLVPLMQDCQLNPMLVDLLSINGMSHRVAVQSDAFLQTCVLHTDPQLLRIILNNLLSNAIKYAQNDTVVDLYATASERNGKQGISIAIRNIPGSAGFPDPAQVFSKYYRSPGAYSKTGSGLGLYLTYSIANLLGADVIYDVVQEKVSFTLWMPV